MASSVATSTQKQHLPPPSRHANTKAARDANAQEWVDRTAADLAAWLQRAGATRTEVASTLSYGRSWLNKLLMARNEIPLADYLMPVELLKEYQPEHPAVKLAQHLRKLPGCAWCRRN